MSDWSDIDFSTMEIIPTYADMLHERRKELRLAQREVAEMSGISLRQYQRLESVDNAICATSFRIAMNVCSALQLDPWMFCPSEIRPKVQDESPANSPEDSPEESPEKAEAAER